MSSRTAAAFAFTSLGLGTLQFGDSKSRSDRSLLSLESPDADAGVGAYLQGQAAITLARANLNKAQADADRATDLFEHNAVAKKDMLTAENALAHLRGERAPNAVNGEVYSSDAYRERVARVSGAK